ncbi:MAG: UMP kinase [Candidatus Bathyarchaeota archaeon]|nr:UMP kinase [Candidatus Bathyarchaeota archaeon]
MRVVVRIGGSVVASPPNPEIMSKYAGLLRELKEQRHELVVVVGGGSVARDFIRIAKDMGLSEFDQDEVAIGVSRLFAQLLAMKLGDLGSGSVPTSVDEAVQGLNTGKIVVMGGVRPGMTTDAVAAMVAEQVGAELLVKATDVDGVFTRDPKKHPNAKKIDELDFDDLSRLFEENRHKAGIHQILDSKAVKVLERSKVRMVVVNGFKPTNVLLAVRGERVGTIIG